MKWVDQLGDGTAVFGPLGQRLMHTNPALIRILASDPEAVRIRLEMEVAARAAVEPDLAAEDEALPGLREVRSEKGPYFVGGTVVGNGANPHDRLVLVTVTPRRAIFPDAEDLKARFGLTAREVDVALLLAKGVSDRQIATELVISWHTARRHSERVLRKLQLSSRGEVASRLLDTSTSGSAF